MPADPPEGEGPEFEREIEVEFEDYDSVDDRVYYKVEIETALFPPQFADNLSVRLVKRFTGFIEPTMDVSGFVSTTMGKTSRINHLLICTQVES